jgi:hypothetical protein
MADVLLSPQYRETAKCDTLRVIALIPSKSALISMLQAHKTIQVSLNYNLHKILIKE